jgi:hypothetical protein
VSPGRSAPRLNNATPSGGRRRCGTLSSIIAGGAGMTRQRQAALPWPSSAPGPAAIKAANSRPCSLTSSGTTME